MVAAAIGAAAVASVGSAAISSSASKSAASQQAQAAQSANATQMQIWDQNNQNLSPFLNQGTAALPTLNQGIQTYQADLANYKNLVAAGNPNSAGSIQAFENTPGYQFQLQQGQQAINNSAASKGGLLSGSTLKDLLSYSQGLAGTTYQNYLSNYGNFLNQNQSVLQGDQQVIGDVQQQVNTGVNAGGAIAGVSENAGNNISANTIGAGNATAAGTVGSANAISGGLSNLASSGSNYALLSQLTNQGTSSYGSAASTSTPADLISSYTGQ